jgi:HPt (histidine-containing phosphotransfer) domain-containing protein
VTQGRSVNDPIPPETLDRTALDTLRQLDRRGGRGALSRIVAAFLTDAPEKVHKLRQGLEAGDAPAMSMTAHTLKGGCGYVGARRLAKLCEQVERAAESGDLNQAEASVAAIEVELVTLTEALKQELLAT